ncbi:LPAAT2 [Auxenochlorella protothecoides x Auxenochlorella symbiontica]
MSLQRTLDSALRWPAFLLSLFILFWSVPFCSLTYYIRFLDLKTERRGDVFSWAVGMKRWFGIKILKVGDRELFRKDCMYLINHRSWGDFLVDQYLTEGRSTFLARAMVAVAFPFFMTVIMVMKATMVFKRGNIPDKEKFNRWIDSEFAATPQTAIAVYPEGHRSTMTDSLPLKRGMLHYAYSRKLPVQVIIAANKEAVLSEKHSTARFGQTIWAGYSEPMFPEEYETFDKFMDKVQATWNEEWNTVFGTKPEGLRELVCQDPKLLTPLHVRRGVSTIIAVVDICFLAIMYYSLRMARRVSAALGPLEAPLLALLAVYVTASLVRYSRPYDGVAASARKGKLAQASATQAPPAPKLAASGVADVSAATINRAASLAAEPGDPQGRQ